MNNPNDVKSPSPLAPTRFSRGAGLRRSPIKCRWLVAAVVTVVCSLPRVARTIEIVPVIDSSITNLSYGADVELTIRAALFEYKYRIKETTQVTIKFKHNSSVTAQNERLPAYVDYIKYRAALAGAASSALDSLAVSSLPLSTPLVTPSSADVFISYPLRRTLNITNGNGISPPPPSMSSPDATISINTGICKVGPDWSFTGVATLSLYTSLCHEINEVLGLYSVLNQSSPPPSETLAPEDLFRYDQNNNRSFTTSSSEEAYLYVPGSGQIVRLNQWTSGDMGDWHTYSLSGPSDARVQDWEGTSFADPRLSDAETKALDIIGYTILPTPCWIDLSIGSDSNGGNYGGGYFYPYQTVTKADANIGSGGAIMVVATGNPTMHTGRISVTTPCKIVPFNGTLRIAP